MAGATIEEISRESTGRVTSDEIILRIPQGLGDSISFCCKSAYFSPWFHMPYHLLAQIRPESSSFIILWRVWILGSPMVLDMEGKKERKTVKERGTDREK
jgi:hypothetical protein